MKIEVNKINGRLLDWCTDKVANGDTSIIIPEYSTDWRYGGPLIERFSIMLSGGGKSGEWYGYLGIADLNYIDLYPGRDDCDSFGPTPLIAVCRAVVISKFGKEIDIPENIIQLYEHID
ncbi:hypothetical protein CIFRMM251M_16665 [Citrobacter freundii]|uniref:phage protein NinX family protein n=1 Tax=Citrobacter freundii TaxID=546 RepID=UPI001A1BC034|nr:DUF2591 domain-containing protein [Citrobacter freundii]